ncbi:M56 family metallopeptidase [Paludibaculum fermentans]|uniref:M48 family metalloprotease n=1 Tax=Paludibaculum fermentans TaxID=1473598 RepID=A0A7S7SLH1_PALFE|nr:M56 family metallopeptidase [Paludibaculum fermentans]QOY88030.1 M48 family metalloprotease [Paludibaculum fermentans]
MTELAHAISMALLHFVWQGVVVAFLLWVALAILGPRPVRLRYALSCAAMLAMSAAPVITVCLLYRAPRPAAVYQGPPAQTADAASTAALAVTALLPRWLAAIEVWTLPVWSAGVIILALRLLWSSRHVARLRREGEPAPPILLQTVSRLAARVGVSRSVHVLLSRLADSPSVVGWLRPVILIPPASFLNLSAAQVEAVLVHELAHIRRHDYLVNLLQTVAETVLFYQPAVWWVSSRIRAERELCCDDVAVEICGDSIGYARALTLLERARLALPEFAQNSATGPLLHRVLRLTGASQPAPRVPAAVAVGLAAVCLLTTVRWAQAQPQMAGEARVSKEAVWVDTVKFGEFPVLVRALGAITGPDTAELQVPSPVVSEVQLGQSASVEVGRGIIAAGTVTRIDSPPSNGTVRVVIQFQAPAGQPAGHPVDGAIRIKVLTDVVYVGRPADQSGGTEASLFKFEADRKSATRVKVRFGAASINSIQVLEGLQPGDRIILSDTTKFKGYDRVRLE